MTDGYGFHLSALELALEAASIEQQYKDLTTMIKENNDELRASAVSDGWGDIFDEGLKLMDVRSAIHSARLDLIYPLIRLGVSVIAPY